MGVLFWFSTLVLIVSNLVTLYYALTQGWGIGTLLFAYWGQAVAIGFFHVFKVIDVRAFSGQTKNKAQMKALDSSGVIQWAVAGFFAIHYSIFMLMFGVMIFIFASRSLDIRLAFSSIGVFFFNHGLSYFLNRSSDRSMSRSLVRMMIFPYLRIFPMQIIISMAALYAYASTPIIILFIGLKTVADVIAHIVEHYISKGARFQGLEESGQ